MRISNILALMIAPCNDAVSDDMVVSTKDLHFELKSLVTTRHNIFKSKFKFYNIDIDRNFPVLIKGDIDMLRDHSKKSRNRSIDIYIRAFDDISRYLSI